MTTPIREQQRADSTVAEEEVLLGRYSETTPGISVVLPAMNEEEGIEDCILSIRTALRELGVTGEIIVSDSSTDRTPEIAEELGAIVVTPDKKGYGYAYQYAFDRVRGEYIVMGDADTTYDFEELPKLFRHLIKADADIVMGSRLAGEIKPGAMPALHKYIGNPLLTRFLNVFYEADVTDAHSGFRVFTSEALAELDCQSHGMEFASEMIMAASEKGLTIEEVPITYHERAGEATLDSFRDGWRHVKFMLLNAPSQLFTAPAIGLSILGLGMMALSLLGTPVMDVYFGAQTMIAGCLLTLVAFQVWSLALFSSVAANTIRQPSDAVTEWIRQHFRLEHGATCGFVLFSLGATVAGYLMYGWMMNGLYGPSAIIQTMLGFTAILLGVQTVFNSFFLSMLAQEW